MKALIGKKHLETVRPEPGKAYIFIQDTAQPALFARIHEGGTVGWVLRYTFKGKRRRLRIGGWPTWTPQEARRRAKLLLAGAEMGIDPAAKEEAPERLTFNDLWPIFLEERGPHWKPLTRQDYCDRWERIIKPAFGDCPVGEVERAEVIRWHLGEKHRPAAANRCLAIFKTLCNFAIDRGAIDKNPCQRVRMFKEEKKERFLHAEEIQRLFDVLDREEQLFTNGTKPRAGEATPGKRGGEGLREVESRGVSPFLAGLVRLLVYTGARLREIMEAQWSWVHWEEGILALPDSKSGKKAIRLSAPALAELRRLHSIRCQDTWIIENRTGDGCMVNPQKPWRRVREAAGLPDVRLHDLRHSWASLAVSSGASLELIGGALGHTQAATTHRYAHLHADPLRELVERVGATIEEIRRTPQAKVLDARKGKTGES